MSTVPRSLLGPLVAALLLAGCGSQTGTPTADAPAAPPEKQSPSEPGTPEAPEGLTCPTNERVATEGGSLAEWPKGADTPEAVVEAKSTPEEPWVLAGKRAYVLRPDGTAFEVHDLVEGPKGWFLHGYEACG
jgi:hypothetical protein